jgi:hypothetical protein
MILSLVLLAQLLKLLSELISFFDRVGVLLLKILDGFFVDLLKILFDLGLLVFLFLKRFKLISHGLNLLIDIFLNQLDCFCLFSISFLLNFSLFLSDSLDFKASSLVVSYFLSKKSDQMFNLIRLLP